MHIPVFLVRLPSCPVGFSIASIHDVGLEAHLLVLIVDCFPSSSIFEMMTHLICPSDHYSGARSYQACAPISDRDCEIIQGGRRGRGEDLPRNQRREGKSSCGGGRGVSSLANVFVVNIYQFNIAVNTILGGTGNSIGNFQANGSAAIE